MRFRRLYACVSFALCATVLLWAGCGSGPFQISGPSGPELPVGFALVTADVPLYIRGVIQRVRVEITSADTSKMSAITREMNFPIPGGSLAAGEISSVPVGLRRFRVTAFDTKEALRFQGSTIDSVRSGLATTLSVPLFRVGGRLRFTATLSSSEIRDSLATVLEGSSVLDIVELGASADMPRLALASTPVLSFTRDGDAFSRQVTIDLVPTGTRRFAGNLRDLRQGKGTVTFTDTVSAKVDTGDVVDVELSLKRLDRVLQLQELVFPRDSTVVILSPNF